MLYTLIILAVIGIVCYNISKNRAFSGKLCIAIACISLGIGAVMCYPLLFIGLVLLFVGYCFLQKAPKAEPKAAEKPAETKPITVC